MTPTEITNRKNALAALDALDRYWAKPRKVEQGRGTLSLVHPVYAVRGCGCFGAHCARALDIKSGSNEYWYGDGRRMLYAIARRLGVPAEDTRQIIRDAASGGQFWPNGAFALTEWLVHPNEAWPAISAELRKRAGVGGSDA